MTTTEQMGASQLWKCHQRMCNCAYKKRNA